MPAPELDDGEIPSPLDELRAAFAKPVAEKRLFKRLPARGGVLAAEYRILTVDEIDKANAADEILAQHQDLLACALVAIHQHNPSHPAANDHGLVPLHVVQPDIGGPVRFDQRLLDLLGVDLDDTSARAICLMLFEDEEPALVLQSAQLGSWMTDTRQEELQDFAAGS